MRKLSFRFLSALLAVCMLLSMASTIVFAEGEDAGEEPAEPVAFAISSTTPEKGEKMVDPNLTFKARFTYNLGQVTKDHVLVEGKGLTEADYDILVAGNEIQIAFAKTLALNEEYKVTLKKGITNDEDGTLDADNTVTFTTADFYLADYNNVVADYNFDALDLGTPFEDGAEYLVDGGTAVVAADEQTSELRTNNVLKITPNGTLFGVPDAKIKTHVSYDSARDEYPAKVKVEFRMKRLAGHSYLYLNDVNDKTEVVTWKNSPKLSVATKEGKETVLINTWGAATWAKFALFFDFTEGLYHVYIGKPTADNDDYIHRATCTIPSDIKNVKDVIFKTTGTLLMDDIKISTNDKDFDIKWTNPQNGLSGADPEKAFVATFSHNLEDVSKDKVQVVRTDNGAVPNYEVKTSGNELQVIFDEKLELSKEYTVTLKKDIKNKSGQNLDKDQQIKFTTAPAYIGRYANKIADLDFEDVPEDKITGLTTTDSKGASTDSSKKYFLKGDTTVNIVHDRFHGSKVAKIVSAGGSTDKLTDNDQIGISSEYLKQYENLLNKKVMVEFEAEKSSSGIYFFPTESTDIMLWSGSSHDFKFKNKEGGSTRQSIDATGFKLNEWVNVKMYFDFEAKTPTYHIFIQDQFKKSFTIPSSLTSLKVVKIDTNGGALVDNIRVYAYDTFGLESINGITDNTGTPITQIDPEQFVATFNNELGEPSKSWVEVNKVDGETLTPVTNYTVAKAGRNLVVKFPEPLELSTQYKITFKGNTKNAKGVPLDVDVEETVKTAPVYVSRYNKEIATYNFETVSGTLTSGNDQYVGDTGTVEIVTDTPNPETGYMRSGNLVKINGNGAIFGIPETKVQNIGNAKRAKLQFSMKRSSAGAYLCLNGTELSVGDQAIDSHVKNEFMIWINGDKELRFATDQGRRKAKYGDGEWATGEWLTVSVYFDFEDMLYYVYITDEDSEELIYRGVQKLYPSFSSLQSVYFRSAGITLMDDITLVAYDGIDIANTNIQKDETNVSPGTAFIATFTKALGEPSKDWVEVNKVNGETLTPVTNYTVTKDGKDLVVKVPGGLEFNTKYAVTLKDTIKAADGQIFGFESQVSFTTAASYGTADDGFNKVVASFDAASYASSKVFTGASDNIAGDNNELYVVSGKEVTFVVDDAEGQVALPATNSYFGIHPSYMSSKNVYYDADTQAYPALTKVQFRYKRPTGTGVTAEFWVYDPDSSETTTQYKNSFGMVKYGRFGLSSQKNHFRSGDLNPDKVTAVIGSERDNDWHTVTMYFDFAAKTATTGGKYYVNVDGTYQGSYDIPLSLKEIRGFAVQAYTSSQVYVKSMSISTVDAYAANGFTSGKISEYTVPAGQGMGFAYTNKSDAPKEIKLIKAEYDAEGILVGTTIEPIPVAAMTSVFNKLAYPASIPAGGSVRYFVWDGFATMKPVTNVKEIR